MKFFKIIMLCILSFIGNVCAMQQPEQKLSKEALIAYFKAQYAGVLPTRTSSLPDIQSPTIMIPRKQSNSSDNPRTCTSQELQTLPWQTSFRKTPGSPSAPEDIRRMIDAFSPSTPLGSSVEHVAGGANNGGIFTTDATVVKFYPYRTADDVANAQKTMVDTKKVFNAGIGQYGYLVQTLGFHQDPHGYVVEVMNKAPGEALDKILFSVEVTIAQKQAAFYATGKRLAEMHKQFKVPGLCSMIHGDFHPANVFFNRDTQTVMFIDGVTSADSIDTQQPIFCDIMHFIFSPLFTSNVLRGNYCESFISCVSHFLQGYITSFHRDDRVNLATRIRDLIELWTSVACGISDQGMNFQQRIRYIQQHFYGSQLITSRPNLARVYFKQEEAVWGRFAESFKRSEDAADLRNKIETCVRVPLCRNIFAEI